MKIWRYCTVFNINFTRVTRQPAAEIVAQILIHPTDCLMQTRLSGEIAQIRLPVSVICR